MTVPLYEFLNENWHLYFTLDHVFALRSEIIVLRLYGLNKFCDCGKSLLKFSTMSDLIELNQTEFDKTCKFS